MDKKRKQLEETFKPSVIQQRARVPLQDVRRVARERPQEFSPQQDALAQMFGQGGKMWGTEMQPVQLNYDLNPRQRGDEGTARMFGF